MSRKQKAGTAVPIGYNKDKSEIPVFSRVCGFVLILFPLKNPPKMGVERGGDKRSFHIKDKFLGAEKSPQGG